MESGPTATLDSQSWPPIIGAPDLFSHGCRADYEYRTTRGGTPTDNALQYGQIRLLLPEHWLEEHTRDTVQLTGPVNTGISNMSCARAPESLGSKLGLSFWLGEARV
jgi:hypothetical protein